MIGRKYTIDDIIQLSRSQLFDSWMVNEKHAIAFYRFLFDSGRMSKVLSCNNRIFLTEDNRIAAPNTIYFNIDTALTELYMFEDLLPRLKKSVRESLLSSFKGIEGAFKHFSPVSTALEFAGGFDRMNYSERIRTKKDSINFLNFIASAKESTSRYNGTIPNSMPIYIQSGETHSGKNNLYVQDELGKSLAKKPWIKDEWISFIDADYVLHSEDLKQLLSRCGITTITPEIIWKNFVANDSRIEHITSSITDKGVNIDFYNFLRSIEKEVQFADPTKALKTEYKIWAEDGVSDCLVPLSTVLYFPSSKEREKLLECEWLPNESCWAIKDEYFVKEDEKDLEAIQRFYINQGIANEFSTHHWIRRCLFKEHIWPETVKLVTCPEISLSLLDFLFTNRAVVKEAGLKKLKAIPLSLEGEDEMLPLTEIPAKETVYQISKDIQRLKNEPWFPEGELTITSEIYTSLFDGNDKRAFFDEVGIAIFNEEKYIEDDILQNLSY